MMRLGAARALAVSAATSPLSAQILTDPQVPGGRIRLDFVPSFQSWDTRFGAGTTEGVTTEEEEKLGSDLTDATGALLFPGILSLQEQLRALTADPSYIAKLGSTVGAVSKEVTRMDVGLQLGVFDWLTLGANVPWVRGRTAVDVAFRADAGSDLGGNPAFSDPSSVTAFLGGLGEVAGLAQARAASLCSGGDPAACSAAQALADRAGAFWSGMKGAYGASPFFPTGASPAGAALSAALAALDGDLTAAGLRGVGAGIPFAAGLLDAQTFASLATDPSTGISGSRLRTVDGLWTMGDVEVSASLRLLDGEVRDSGDVSPRFAYSLSAGALVRLGTGTPDDPNVFLDIGSGDGQMDMEGRVSGMLQFGRRLELRGGYRYGVQDAVTLLRRVAPPEQILAPVSTSRAVVWTPGSYSFIDASPRLHLTPELSLALDYHRYHKAADSYELAGAEPDGVPPVDVGDLMRETEMGLQQVALGIRYSTLRTWRADGSAPPLEMALRLVRSVAGSGGQTPKATRFEMGVSVFKRIWGRR